MKSINLHCTVPAAAEATSAWLPSGLRAAVPKKRHAALPNVTSLSDEEKSEFIGHLLCNRLLYFDVTARIREITCSLPFFFLPLTNNSGRSTVLALKFCPAFDNDFGHSSQC